MSDETRAPTPRRQPVGGQVGVTLVTLVPFLALALFFLFGFMGHWAWSWIFFLLIPVVRIVVYGPTGRADT